MLGMLRYKEQLIPGRKLQSWSAHFSQAPLLQTGQMAVLPQSWTYIRFQTISNNFKPSAKHQSCETVGNPTKFYQIISFSSDAPLLIRAAVLQQSWSWTKHCVNMKFQSLASNKPDLVEDWPTPPHKELRDEYGVTQVIRTISQALTW